MFGGSRKNNNTNESLSAILTPENPPGTKKGGGGGNIMGFDPEGLERAAKAARELDGSRNANQAIELIKTQEVTKQVGVNCAFFVVVKQTDESDTIYKGGEGRFRGLVLAMVLDDGGNKVFLPINLVDSHLCFLSLPASLGLFLVLEQINAEIVLIRFIFFGRTTTA